MFSSLGSESHSLKNIVLPTCKINCSYDNADLQFFTDGSTVGNGKKNAIGGYCYVCVSGFMKGRAMIGNMAKNSQIPPTNIKAEAEPIIAILEILYNKENANKWNKCRIYTDSMFWKNMIYKYMPNWVAKGRDFNQQKNPHLTTKIWKLWNDINASENKVELIHVYAHNKTGGKQSTDKYHRFCYDNNFIADQLANWGRTNLRDDEIIYCDLDDPNSS